MSVLTGVIDRNDGVVLVMSGIRVAVVATSDAPPVPVSRTGIGNVATEMAIETVVVDVRRIATASATGTGTEIATGTKVVTAIAAGMESVTAGLAIATACAIRTGTVAVTEVVMATTGNGIAHGATGIVIGRAGTSDPLGSGGIGVRTTAGALCVRMTVVRIPHALGVTTTDRLGATGTGVGTRTGTGIVAGTGVGTRTGTGNVAGTRTGIVAGGRTVIARVATIVRLLSAGNGGMTIGDVPRVVTGTGTETAAIATATGPATTGPVAVVTVTVRGATAATVDRATKIGVAAVRWSKAVAASAAGIVRARTGRSRCVVFPSPRT